MKKENRKMAQQRRARERRKKERIRKLKKLLIIAIPCLAVIILITAIALSSRSSSGDNSSADTAAEGTSAADASDTGSSDTDSPSYSTDTSLTVESGDTVNIDYVGTVDGVEFEGGSTNGSGADLEIGSGSYIDGFEDQLIGAHPGDTVDVTVTFPEDYGVDELNGKEAVFTVTVNGIYE